MKDKVKIFFIFLILNFSALGIGSYFTGSGVTSDWYINLVKAPWTPPGYVFGISWTVIMICYAIYLSIMVNSDNKKKLMYLYALQWILNVLWNPIFFGINQTGISLIEILLLLIVVSYTTFTFLSPSKKYSLLNLPYIIWLLIASSLNTYIWLYN